MNQQFELNIIHKNNYKIYIMKAKKDIKTNELYEPKIKDFHLWSILTENFFSNCEKNNYKFAIIFDLENIKSIPFVIIPEICNFFNKYQHVLEKLLICNCIMINKESFKNMINIFLKFYIPIKPIKLCNNINESEEFINICYTQKLKYDKIIY